MRLFLLMPGLGLALAGTVLAAVAAGAQPVAPTASGPIALTANDGFLWVVDPDGDSVAVVDVQNDANQKVAEVPVGDEPWNVAVAPDGTYAAVSNTAAGTVSLVKTDTTDRRVVNTVPVGAEPWGLAFTPNGTRLYVANAGTNTVHVINVKRGPEKAKVGKVIKNVGLAPRDLAITDDGDDEDKDEKLYVTQFLSFTRPSIPPGRDDSAEGRVTVVSTKNNKVLKEIVLAPLETGFLSNGSAIERVPGTEPPTFFFPTVAFPNLLQNIVIKGNRAYLPNTASSPDGPVRFDVNVQAFLSVIDLTTDTEATVNGQRQTINMNRGIDLEPAGPNRLFFSTPWAVAFAHQANEGYVVSAGSNLVVKVTLDGNGTPTIGAPAAPADPGTVVRIPVGQNPRGIVINSTDTRAYVMNYVSRDVSVIDTAQNAVVSTIPTAALPAPGTQDATLQIGKALFHTSTGVNLPQLGSAGVISTRMSDNGWGSCFNCHPFGMTDGVTSIFPNGPRQTIPLNGTFGAHDPSRQRILNYSAIFDETADFELNIRGVSGGAGLITLGDGTTPDPNVAAFDPPNAGRSEALDALSEWVRVGFRTPTTAFDLPVGSKDRQKVSRVAKGGVIFVTAGCQTCHGGPGWSSALLDFTPPPAANDVVDGQLIRFLFDVGTYDAANASEVADDGAPSLGAAGFNPPSLLGIGATAPYLHHGSATTLERVVENVAHRSAGTGGVDKLARKSARKKLVAFLRSISDATAPFALPPPTECGVSDPMCVGACPVSQVCCVDAVSCVCEPEANVDVIRVGGKCLPVDQLRIQGIDVGCDAEHWHADNSTSATALDGTLVTDPGGCGYGKTAEVPVGTVEHCDPSCGG